MATCYPRSQNTRKNFRVLLDALPTQKGGRETVERERPKKPAQRRAGKTGEVVLGGNITRQHARQRQQAQESAGRPRGGRNRQQKRICPTGYRHRGGIPPARHSASTRYE